MMMNENNEVFTMEDEPLASVVQNMRKGSKWLSAFLESYRPPLDGERYLTDREVAELLRVSRRTLQEYRNNRVLPFILLGGKVLYPESGLRELLEANYRKADGIRRLHEKKGNGQLLHGAVRFLFILIIICLLRFQQYPAFPFCMNITYACRFSFESAFSTSHVRNTCAW